MEELIRIISQQKNITELIQAMQNIHPYDSWQGQTLYKLIRARMTRLQRIGNYKESIKLKHGLIILIHAQRKMAAKHTRKRFLRKYIHWNRREKRIREAIWGKKVFGDITGRDDTLGPVNHIQSLLHPGEC